jgi:hypothetical protein
MKTLISYNRNLINSAALSTYFWFLLATAYLLSRQNFLTRMHTLRVYTRFKNIRYTRDAGNVLIYQSHAFILRLLSVFTKYKFKNPKYYALSFNFLIHSIKATTGQLSLLYIKGLRVIAFLETYKLWTELPFSKQLSYILVLNKSLSAVGVRRQQSIKRRLRKKIIKIERYKL